MQFPYGKGCRKQEKRDVFIVYLFSLATRKVVAPWTQTGALIAGSPRNDERHNESEKGRVFTCRLVGREDISRGGVHYFYGMRNFTCLILGTCHHEIS